MLKKEDEKRECVRAQRREGGGGVAGASWRLAGVFRVWPRPPHARHDKKQLNAILRRKTKARASEIA